MSDGGQNGGQNGGQHPIEVPAAPTPQGRRWRQQPERERLGRQRLREQRLGERQPGNHAAKVKRPDLWRPVPQLADPASIVPAPDPTALLRSLGDPPLQGQGAVAEHYLAAVVERAAGLATALAVAAGLLADPDLDD